MTTPTMTMIIVVGDISNFHFDTIPSSLGISINGIEYVPILDNPHAYNTHAYINVKFSVKNVKAL